MTQEFRRIIAAQGSDGKSYVLSAEAPALTMEIPNVVKMYDLWRTETSPAQVPILEDMELSGPVKLEPGEQGTRFGFAVVPPRSESQGAASAEEVFELMDATEARERGDPSIDPTMHATDTIDYQLVLSGELWLILEKDEILVKPGDFVVQGGVNHTWQNRSDQPAVLLAVLVGARRT